MWPEIFNKGVEILLAKFPHIRSEMDHDQSHPAFAIWPHETNLIIIFQCVIQKNGIHDHQQIVPSMYSVLHHNSTSLSKFWKLPISIKTATPFKWKFFSQHRVLALASRQAPMLLGYVMFLLHKPGSKRRI